MRGRSSGQMGGMGHSGCDKGRLLMGDGPLYFGSFNGVSTQVAAQTSTDLVVPTQPSSNSPCWVPQSGSRITRAGFSPTRPCSANRPPSKVFNSPTRA